DVLSNKQDFEAPRFKAWLTSTNKHVVLFSLRLIKYFRQNDANASVVELIKHKDHQVRHQAIDCIKEFYVIEALPTLKGVFWKCTIDIKIAILGAIAELGTARDIEFLESVSQREGNFSVKSKAVGAINTIVPESVMPTEGIEYVKDYQNPDEPNPPPVPEEIPPEAGAAEERKSIVPDARPDQNSSKNTDLGPNHNPEQNKDQSTDHGTDQVPLPNPIQTEKERPMASKEQSDEALRNIEIVFDEIRPTASDESDTEEHADFDISTIQFLPVVVADETDEVSERPDAPDHTDIPVNGLNNIEVHSIEDVSETMDEELEALVAEIKEIAFLPFVTDEEAENQLKVDEKQQAVEAAEGEEVARTHEEASGNHKELAGIHEESETDDDAETDEEGKAHENSEGQDARESEKNQEETGEQSESLENIDGYSLSDFEVSFAEKNSDDISEELEPVDFELKEEPIVNVENPQVEDVLSWIMADNEMRNIECQYELIPHSADEQNIQEFIPEPVYYDEHEAYMMGLLDDLEVLGDHREIPLLEELKAEESKSFIKDRIDLMIHKFSLQRNTKKTERAEPKRDAIVLPVFSVFADLFKTIDTESKLILLDEVVTVGDEKEIEFLDALLEDPEQKIRDKAQIVLKQLIAKLSRENPSTTYSKGVSDILAEQIKNDEALSEQIYDNLLSELGLDSATKSADSVGNKQDSSSGDIA
ncbi:MAG: hypothetical protein WA913_07305, partial [Pricia sp.]